MKHELRTIQAAAEVGESRKAESGSFVHGTGVIYDQWTEIFPGLMERIERGAVRLADEVKSYFNHSPDYVLSTTKSNPPLRLNDTPHGLRYSSPIPNTSYGSDLVENLKRRNVRGSSFAFMVPHGGDKCTEDIDGVLWRTITDLELFELGPVSDPAYPQTDAIARAKEVADAWRRLKKPEPVRPTLRLNGKSHDPISPALRARLDRTEAEAMGFAVPLTAAQRKEVNRRPGRRRTENELLVRHGQLKNTLDD